MTAAGRRETASAADRSEGPVRAACRAIDRWLGLLVEGLGAALVAAEIVILLAGVVCALRVRSPARLVRRARLDPVPVARHARRGDRAAPRRAYAHDRGRGRSCRRRRGPPSSFRSRRGARLPRSHRLAGLSTMRSRKRRSRRPRLQISDALARRGDAGRDRADGDASPLLRLRQDRAAARLAAVALGAVVVLLALFWLAQPVLQAARQSQSVDLLRRRGRRRRVRRRADRLCLRTRRLRLSGADDAYAARRCWSAAWTRA